MLNLSRDNTQLLINQLWDLPTERYEDAIVVQLPKQKFILPRSKPVPKPKPLTKWQQFAKAKGIQKKKQSKLSWDEQLQKWVPRYGFRRSTAEKEKQWVLEVPQNADPLEDQFQKKKFAKGERIAKNELQRLRNIARARKVKIPRVGIPNPDVSTAKDVSLLYNIRFYCCFSIFYWFASFSGRLFYFTVCVYVFLCFIFKLQAAVTVAKASTASLGKFQEKLPKEKEARGVAAVTPGASRKRKLPPVSSTEEKNQNLSIADSVLNKKPKISVEKVVTRQVQKKKKKHV